MNLAINNSTAKQAKAQGPDAQTASASNSKTGEEGSQGIDLGNSRAIAEDLAIANTQKTTKAPEPQEEKAVKALTKVANLFRGLGSKVLNGVGFVGVTIAALSYIMFNFKLIAAFFGIPSIGAFFIANTLKKSAKAAEKDLGMSADPSTIVEKAKQDSTYLEKNFNKVTAAMVEIGEMKDSNPKKEPALANLKDIARKVSAKMAEIDTVDKTSHEQIELKKFLEIYQSITNDENHSEAELDDPSLLKAV